MKEIPITFTFRDKTYSGHFWLVAGAGSTAHFHLSVGGYHMGQLWLTDSGWKFESNSIPEMRELSGFFGDYVTGWVG